ncbi:hypothetical protein SAM23877_3851 [Streptomyces ambofaciens ATCC 23877]|uniref:DUF2867 domain-containing protein n=2 Tax=Streptomyces ambofaciens TaxID=1889 RepID=A0A0K2AVG4_STRA7|nr:DUF2867 domain-containing protein [Streptomyces ambofaciens]AKZ56896.1 hypothetical protein SAM23877_3851 [Streptomyces ambofaciens ATCC 23877]ANB07455.1 hypothetical protein SAM40697_3497 [Streptomyces ambofaciens]
MAPTGTPGIRRVRVDPDGAHRASAFALPTAGLPRLTPEEWVRASYEDVPAPLRELIRAGWAGVLGLRLGPRHSARHVAGWRTVESGPARLAVEARAPSLTVRNVVTADGARLVWATYVRYERRAGRALWSLAAPVHHLALPLLLGRAVRRRT